MKKLFKSKLVSLFATALIVFTCCFATTTNAFAYTRPGGYTPPARVEITSIGEGKNLSSNSSYENYTAINMQSVSSGYNDVNSKDIAIITAVTKVGQVFIEVDGQRWGENYGLANSVGNSKVSMIRVQQGFGYTNYCFVIKGLSKGPHSISVISSPPTGMPVSTQLYVRTNY